MPSKQKKNTRSSIILPEEQYRQIEKIAAANDVSVAWVIRLAITNLLANQSAVSNLKFKRR